MTSPWSEYTWDGVDGWLWDAKAFVSKDYDPETGVCVIFLAPPGGRATVPAIATGPSGPPPTLLTPVVTEIEPGDTMPAWSWEVVTPGSAGVASTLKLHAYSRKGTAGVSGSTVLLSATDLVGTPAAGYFPAYVVDKGLAAGGAATGTGGALWTPQKVGGVYWPASIANTTSGDGPQRTIAQTASIPEQPFAWRPRPFAQSIITPTGSDVRVDLIARVGNASTGDIVGRCYGIAAATERQTITPGPETGSASTVGQIAAGVGPTVVYLRGERQSGADSFGTAGSTTRFYVEVAPLP